MHSTIWPQKLTNFLKRLMRKREIRKTLQDSKRPKGLRLFDFFPNQFRWVFYCSLYPCGFPLELKSAKQWSSQYETTWQNRQIIAKSASPNDNLFPFSLTTSSDSVFHGLSVHLSFWSGKKSKSVFDFLTYSRETGFSFSYGKVGELIRLIGPSNKIDRVSKFDNSLSFGAKQNALR